MSESTAQSSRLRLGDLSQSKPTAFLLTPSPEECRDIADQLSLSALRKLRFEGSITAQGKADWKLEARLGATLVQPCVATLDPVTTRIDEPVTRLFLANYEEPDGTEVEMPEDDTVEPVPSTVDLWTIMREALALNVPPYPRSSASDPITATVTEPGKTPLTDQDLRPFAGLADLRDALGKDESTED